MNIWSWFTGGGKTVETITDGIVNGIDKIFYTDEEKSDTSAARQTANNKALELFTEYQRATLPQNVARRQIALIVSTLWGFFIVIAGASVVFSFSFSDELTNFINNNINPPFMLIIAFYFLKRMGNPFSKKP